MTATEHGEQMVVIAWARLHERRYPALTYLFAVPNGGWRAWNTAKRLKAEGTQPGVPDLLMPYPSGDWLGLAIEMKTTRGRPTAAQDKWIERLRAVGWRAEVCFGADAAIQTLRDYLGVREE